MLTNKEAREQFKLGRYTMTKPELEKFFASTKKNALVALKNERHDMVDGIEYVCKILPDVWERAVTSKFLQKYIDELYTDFKDNQTYSLDKDNFIKIIDRLVNEDGKFKISSEHKNKLDEMLNYISYNKNLIKVVSENDKAGQSQLMDMLNSNVNVEDNFDDIRLYSDMLYEFMVKHNIGVTNYNVKVIYETIAKGYHSTNANEEQTRIYLNNNEENFHKLDYSWHLELLANNNAMHFIEHNKLHILNYQKIIDNITPANSEKVLSTLFQLPAQQLNYSNIVKLNEVAEKLNYTFRDVKLYNLTPQSLAKYWNEFVAQSIMYQKYELYPNYLHTHQTKFVKNKLKDNPQVLTNRLIEINHNLFPYDYPKEAIKYFTTHRSIHTLYYIHNTDVNNIINTPLINDKLILLAFILKSYHNNDIQMLRQLLLINMDYIKKMIKNNVVPIDISTYNPELHDIVTQENNTVCTM